MPEIYFETSGTFSKTEKWLARMLDFDPSRFLEKYAKRGVDALSAATPRATGLTASSWSYEIHSSKDRWTIYWINSNVNKGVPIALILQLGHGTRNGGYVQGRDYINPALRPVFDDMAKAAWEEVTRGDG